MNKKLKIIIFGLSLYFPFYIVAQDLSELNQAGAMAYQAGEYAKALEIWQRGLTEARKMQENTSIPRFLNNLGSTYAELGNYEKSLYYNQQALVLNQKNLAAAADNELNIGLAYSQLGLYTDALSALQRAINLYQKQQLPAGASHALGNLASIYFLFLDEPILAQDNWKKALIMAEKAQELGLQGRWLSNLGSVARYQHEYDTALIFFEQAKEIYEKKQDNNGKIEVLRQLALTYMYMEGQAEKALYYLQMVLNLYRVMPAHQAQEATILIQLANLQHFLLKRSTVALSLLQEALRLNQQRADKQAEGLTYLAIGLIHLSNNQLEAAAPALQASLTRLQATPHRWQVECALGEWQAKQKRYAMAWRHYQQALIALEENHNLLIDKNYPPLFLPTREEVYKQAIAVLTMQKGLEKEAFLAWQRLQHFSLQTAIQENSLLNEPSIETIEQQLLATRRNLWQIKPHPEAVILEKTLQTRLNTLSQQHKTAISRLNSTISQWFYTPILPLETIQNMLNTQEIMLIYHVQTDNTVLWIIQKNHFQQIILPVNYHQWKELLTRWKMALHAIKPALQIAENRQLQGLALQRWLEAATDETLSLFLTQSLQLSEQLLPTIAQQTWQILPQHVWIIAPEPLNNLSFSALVRQKNSSTIRYWIEDFSISYIPHLRYWQKLKKYRQSLVKKVDSVTFSAWLTSNEIQFWTDLWEGEWYTRQEIEQSLKKGLKLSRLQRELLQKTYYRHPFFWAGMMRIGDD